MSVQVQKLRGHRAEILSLDKPDLDSTFALFSGSADGTARLWDARESFCSAMCFLAPNRTPVNAVQFAKKAGEINQRFFISSENQILCFDSRKHEVPLVLWKATDMLCSFPVHREEINEIKISPSGTQLAACDDTGAVYIYPLHSIDTVLNRAVAQSLRPTAIFSHASENNIICSSVCFQSEKQIVSGGFDCTVTKWSSSTKKEIYRVNLNQVVEQQKQVVNPPFVYSVDYSKDRIAIACGNGSVYIVRDSTQSVSVIEDAHKTEVSQVKLFHSTGKDFVCTAGNDSYLNVWQLLTPAVLPTKTTVPPPNPQPKSQRGKRQRKKPTKSSATTAPRVPDDTNKPEETNIVSEVEKKVFTISHGSKINVIAVSNSGHQFFVGDQSNEISLYTS